MNTTEEATGQWVGRSSLANGEPSFIMVNVEARSPQSSITVGVEPKFQLRTLSQGSIHSDGNKSTGKTWDYNVFDPATDALVPLAVFYRQHGVEAKPPREAEYQAEFDGRKTFGTFKNDLGQEGRFELWKSFSEAMTGEPPPVPETKGPMTWEEFKNHVAKFRSRGRVLFRGQNSNADALRTSFHRVGRNNLFRYLNEEAFRLRHQINAISAHNYQSSGEDLLGLLSLAQHHGFPTPLLDWTESPYVAAFFAFDCLIDKAKWFEKKERPPVRVFTFDLERWRKIDRQWASSLKDPWPDFQFFHPPAHNNPRYYPQQSMAAFSNVDDIEGFVGAFERQQKATYLTRIDIHANEREIVEDELRFMGITPATLFPGVEGACKALRSELF
jgi:hypothetical protein